MATSPILPNEARRLHLDDYAEVVETADEWEGLIGVVEDFLDENGDRRRSDCSSISCIVLHIPTQSDTQRQLRLRDVNELTSFVRGQLRIDDDRYCFPVSSLAWFDPDWL